MQELIIFCIEGGKNSDENKFYRNVKNRCKDCLNKQFKCEFCGKLTNHIEREYRQNESNSSVIEKPKFDNVDNNKNNRKILVCPSFSGKSSLLLKILSRIPDRDFYLTNKSPPEQY